jgi:hypothetical protein
MGNYSNVTFADFKCLVTSGAVSILRNAFRSKHFLSTRHWGVSSVRWLLFDVMLFDYPFCPTECWPTVPVVRQNLGCEF